MILFLSTGKQHLWGLLFLNGSWQKFLEEELFMILMMRYGSQIENMNPDFGHSQVAK